MIVVDRIESNRAVLVFGTETVEVPASALPAGAGEGAVLCLVRDEAAEATRRQEAQARLDRLKAADTLPDEIDL